MTECFAVKCLSVLNGDIYYLDVQYVQPNSSIHL